MHFTNRKNAPFLFSTRIGTPPLLTVSLTLISVKFGNVHVGPINLQLFSANTVQFGDNKLERVAVAAGNKGPLPIQQMALGGTILENGGFETGARGWGTGWFEGAFPFAAQEALLFNGAVARWSVDKQRTHTGESALHVEHKSEPKPHVYSSFSQRIKVTPGHRYEVKFWAYLEKSDRSGFVLRVLPSRSLAEGEWERFKKKLDSSVIDRWQEVRTEFLSGSDWFFDVRFFAESPLAAWIDDVSVTSLDDSR